MTKCNGCDKWLDGQDDFLDHDEGVLCVECATEWYGEEALTIEADKWPFIGSVSPSANLHIK